MFRNLPEIERHIEAVTQLFIDAEQLLAQHEILLASATEIGDRALAMRARGLVLTMREVRNERGRYLAQLRARAAAARESGAELRRRLAQEHLAPAGPASGRSRGPGLLGA